MYIGNTNRWLEKCIVRLFLKDLIKVTHFWKILEIELWNFTNESQLHFLHFRGKVGLSPQLPEKGTGSDAYSDGFDGDFWFEDHPMLFFPLYNQWITFDRNNHVIMLKKCTKNYWLRWKKRARFLSWFRTLV